MTVRYYLADVVGSGVGLADAYRPVNRDILPGVPVPWSGTVSFERTMVGLPVSDDQHATLIADPRMTYLPLGGPGPDLTHHLGLMVCEVGQAYMEAIMGRLVSAGFQPLSVGRVAETDWVRDAIARMLQRSTAHPYDQ